MSEPVPSPAPQKTAALADAGVEVRPLSPELLQDFLAYFEGDAFADNPKWASCYCQFLYVDHNKVTWKERSAVENRAAACERICSRRMQGYLACLGGKPVGWCNAAPRTMMEAFDDEPDPDAARIGEITCFVVAKPHRRSGIATALLHAACDGLKAQGLTIAEAIPLAQTQSDAETHYGPLAMYLAAGFSVHRTEDKTVCVRRSLV
jgi:GNAT superfamily N-acetyltransferase